MCQGRAMCLRPPPPLTAAVYWLSYPCQQSCMTERHWITYTRGRGGNGSVDKKSSLLPQIHRLNAVSRAGAAPRASGSENATLTELWRNPPVTVFAVRKCLLSSPGL